MPKNRPNVNPLTFWHLLKADGHNEADRIVGAAIARLGRVPSARELVKLTRLPHLSEKTIEGALGRLRAGNYLVIFEGVPA